MQHQWILDCSLAAYTLGWCMFFGLIVARSLPHNRIASPRSSRFVRPRPQRCCRRASFNV